MSAYEDRPWLSLYGSEHPPDIAPEFATMLSAWRKSVERCGHRPLIHYFETAHTLNDVDADSDALAVALAERGVGRGDRVALYLQNVPQFVVSLLASWKLGAIAVAVNPMLKERELHYILHDSGATALISLQGLWNSVAAKVVDDSSVTVAVTTSPLDYMEQERPQLLESAQRLETPGAEDLVALLRTYRGRQPEPVPLASSDVATLTYTSGTTGEPKGAMNTHQNVAFNAQAFRDWMGLTREDTCLAGAPVFHITGLVLHVAVAMCVPMPMVLGYRFDPATINELIERHRPTYTVMAITAFTAMMNDPSIRERDLSSLSKVYSGGAPVAPGIVERFEREVGPYIHNIYGLTETTSATHAVPYGRRAPVDPASGALSIGVPVFNNVIRIVDENGADMPAGELGELAIDGPEVVPGYWGKPEATASTLPGGEMRTGDAGFMDEQGWFYLVDRKKDMIVAAGYKVWPREVEDVLLEHPAVREAAVVGVPDDYRGESVKAYVSLRSGDSGAATTPDDLIGFCRERMAAYKYPRSVEVLEDLPKTPTGKLLRRELRARH